MLAALSPYGAGPSYCWSGTNISLGGILSDALPEDRFDCQPLWSPDRSFCLVADVRLDNRADLARTLHLVKPEEVADSSFLAAAWTRWGVSCLDHILGAFAFAVWIPDRQELFAARDHAGERPLYYHRGKHLFALASMPKALLALPGASQGFDQPQLANWLAPAPLEWSNSFYAGIRRVPMGHFLRVTPNTFECRQYWHPSHAKPTRYKKDQDYADALVEILDRATEARLRTSKAVGAELSAGLDSSSVTASAARLLGAQGKTLTAFTAIPRPEFNALSKPWLIPSEGAAAAEVVRHYPNVEHFLVDTRGRPLLGTTMRWTAVLDEPTINMVNLQWLDAIFEQASQCGIGVMLEGASGNATISWETSSIFAYLFRRMRWIKLVQTTHRLRGHGDISLRTAAAASLTGLLPAWSQRLVSPFDPLQSYATLASPELAPTCLLKARALPGCRP